MIPEQLKEMAFCRVYKKTKRPIGEGWTNIFYTYEQIQDYFPAENYGVLTGINGFGALDDDTKDKMLLKLYDQNFPETMQVRGHYYLKLKGWNGKKITFYNLKERLGELQGLGQQVVGAGSLHPSGEVYEIIKNIPIVEIEYRDFVKVFDKFIKKIQVRELVPTSKEWDGEKLQDIPITNIFPSGLKKCVSCGCKTGTNFQVFPSTNSYFCFHSWTGGGIWEAIAISEGIKHCSDIGKGCLTNSEAKQIIEIAKEKYGLRQTKIKRLPEPRGWALSISITRMAQRYNLTNCHQCNQPFKFIEAQGFFECQTCKYRGGLKKFVEQVVMEAQNEMC